MARKPVRKASKPVEKKEKLLTLNQLEFAKGYVETGNASEAYRRAYPKSRSWKPEAVRVQASRLLATPNVCLRVEALQAKHAKRHEITIDTITQMLLEDRQLAREEKQTSAAVSAAKALGELHGLYIKRVEQGKPGDFEELENMTDAELASLARGSSGGTVTPQDRAAQSSRVH